MSFKKVYYLPADLSEDEFFRRILVKLAQSGRTDPEVVDVTFGTVEKSVCEVVYGKVHLETDASASVGYDREERYQKEVKKFDKNNRPYTEWVWDTRIVTDWTPYSTHETEETEGAGLNGPHGDDPVESSLFEGYNLLAAVEAAKRNPALEEMTENIVLGKSNGTDYPVLSAFGEEDLKNKTHPYIRYPGDHVKDIRENSIKQILSTDCYVLPIYKVTFTCRGKEYRAYTFGFGNETLCLEYPVPENKLNAQEKGIEASKPFKKAFIVSWIFCGVAALAQAILCYWGIWWVGFFALAGFVSAITLHIIRNAKYDKVVKELTEEYASAKKKQLEKSLQRRGYAPLTDSESDVFKSLAIVDGVEKSDIQLSSPGVVGIIVGVILALFLGITMGIGSSRKKSIAEERIAAQEAAIYTLSQASAEVTGLWSGYRSSGFSSGYCVEFTLIVKAKDVAIRSANAQIEIYNKNGGSIGTVRVSLSNLNLSAGQQSTQKVTLGSGGSVFDELYGEDASSFRFVVKITQINFENGKVAN